jgi:hypothetical protein
MCAADNGNKTRNSEDVTESKEILKDLLWGLYQDVRTHARHNETIRSNAINFMLLLASALLVVISLDGRLNNKDLPFTAILILVGLIGMVFAASYAELYYRHRAKSGRLLRELDTLFFQDQPSINLSDIFPSAHETHADTTDADPNADTTDADPNADTTDANYEYEGKLHEFEYKYKWARRITGKAGSTHVFWILLPFVVFLVGIVLTVWALLQL